MQNEPIRVTKAQFCAHAEAYLDLAAAEKRQINIGDMADSPSESNRTFFLLAFTIQTSSQALQASKEKMERTLSEMTGVTGGYRLEQLPVQGEHGWILNRLVGWRPNRFGCECRIEVAVSEHAKFTQNELTLRVLAMPLDRPVPMLGAYVLIPRAWSSYDSEVFRDALLKMLNRDGAFIPVSEGWYAESELSIPRLEIPKD